MHSTANKMNSDKTASEGAVWSAIKPTCTKVYKQERKQTPIVVNKEKMVSVSCITFYSVDKCLLSNTACVAVTNFM